MAETALVTGRIERGTITSYRVVGNPIIAHYVLDDEWTHPGTCLTKLLDIQYATGGYPDRELVWDTLVELGAWTVEWSSREELPDGATCITCGKAVL